MTKNQILKRIFKLSTITFHKKDAFIYHHNKPDEYVDYDFVMMLKHLNIIELDSGNFETEETHYQLNSDFIELRDNIRFINLNKIEAITNSSRLYYEFRSIFDIVKKELQRKSKLLKLNLI